MKRLNGAVFPSRRGIDMDMYIQIRGNPFLLLGVCLFGQFAGRVGSCKVHSGELAKKVYLAKGYFGLTATEVQTQV